MPFPLHCLRKKLTHKYLFSLQLHSFYTQILTPAHFAQLNNLRLAAAKEAADAGGGSAAKRKLAMLEANKKSNPTGAQDDEVFLSEGDILGPRKRAKENYEERMKRIAEGREGRDKFGSSKGKKKADVHSSSTNREVCFLFFAWGKRSLFSVV